MNKEKDEAKEDYEKPRLRIIELAAEEIMGVCKVNAATPGPMSSRCSFCSRQYGGS